ncbi:hypothetical protein QYF36_011401 [Acer negundo]|nr:hypothetical protein QYF36_011401 [Acer negundo]
MPDRAYHGKRQWVSDFVFLQSQSDVCESREAYIYRVEVKDRDGKGKLVSIILAKDEIVKLKSKLKNRGLLLETDIE